MTETKDARPNRAIDTIRGDIDPANTWIVSDTHFGHENIVGYCHRPLDHDQVIIANWRAVVPEDATVLHLGDLTYSGNAWFKHIVAKELTGKRKLLINNGNHDGQRYSFYRDCGFKLARPFSIYYDPDPRSFLTDLSRCLVSFSHYAWSEDEGRPMTEQDWRIHGHIHNSGYTREALVPFRRNHINVSVEQTRYTPVNLKLLLDAQIAGVYPQTTEEQLREAAIRKKANLKAKGGR